MACQKVEIVRGTSNTFQILVYDADGRPYDLGSNERIVFGIKKDPDVETEPMIVKTGEIIGNGMFTVKLCPEDTAELKCGAYFYDVGLDTGTDFFNVIEPSPFQILANVTHRGCAE